MRHVGPQAALQEYLACIFVFFFCAATLQRSKGVVILEIVRGSCPDKTIAGVVGIHRLLLSSQHL